MLNLKPSAKESGVTLVPGVLHEPGEAFCIKVVIVHACITRELVSGSLRGLIRLGVRSATLSSPRSPKNVSGGEGRFPIGGRAGQEESLPGHPY
ncbi:MAG TPA: hypothetical protein VLH40_04175 [Atribacteraceae bacterium]|nr:hypothetical protein [Atribacteraceae bacterium]